MLQEVGRCERVVATDCEGKRIVLMRMRKMKMEGCVLRQSSEFSLLPTSLF
jgi:hypothetical protein